MNMLNTFFFIYKYIKQIFVFLKITLIIFFFIYIFLNFFLFYFLNILNKFLKGSQMSSGQMTTVQELMNQREDLKKELETLDILISNIQKEIQ